MITTIIEFLRSLTNLQILLLIITFSFILFFLRTYKRKKIGLFSFLLFFFGCVSIAIFALKVERLNAIGITFGLNRGADLIVYLSIMILFYLVISVYGKNVSLYEKQTDLVRSLSIAHGVGSYQDAMIVFVIPAYNESDHTLQILQEILDKGYGVVFIDDGSQNDLYSKVISQFKGKKLLAIKHFTNFGQGAALQTGFDAILQDVNQVQYVVTFDSDGQHSLSDLSNFLSAFEKRPDLDIVLGSRFLGKVINMPYAKKIVLKIGIIFTSLFSGLHLTDTHNGYRAIPISSLHKIKITMNGMEHASEILDIISQKKLRYKEVPNTIVYTEYSMARGQKLSNSFKIVKNLIFKKFFSR